MLGGAAEYYYHDFISLLLLLPIDDSVLHLCLCVCVRAVGKVVFAEVMLAALAFSGDCYYDNSWRRAAAMVTSPPLRPRADTADALLNCLAKYAFQFTLCCLCNYLMPNLHRSTRSSCHHLSGGVNWL